MAVFSRAMKMNNPQDYAKVFRQAGRINGKGLTILSIDNSVGHPRLGLAIAKKHIRLAVRRNRVKRLIRESFRHHLAMFANIDIVVLSRTDSDKLDTAKINMTLAQYWATVETQWKKP